MPAALAYHFQVPLSSFSELKVKLVVFSLPPAAQDIFSLVLGVYESKFALFSEVIVTLF